MKKTNTPPIDEAEWQAQEHGLRAASGTDAGLPPAVAAYRAVAEAMIALPRSEPPADFASAVVKRVARSEAGMERPLSRILLLVFVLASVMLAALYGEQSWQVLRQRLGVDALGWLLAGFGCVSLSWMGNRAMLGYGARIPFAAHGEGK